MDEQRVRHALAEGVQLPRDEVAQSRAGGCSVERERAGGKHVGVRAGLILERAESECKLMRATHEAHIIAQRENGGNKRSLDSRADSNGRAAGYVHHCLMRDVAEHLDTEIAPGEIIRIEAVYADAIECRTER